MKKLLSVFIIFAPTALAFADCIVPPNHQFEMTVYRCQAASFGIDLIEDYSWYKFRQEDKTQHGMIVSGYVSKNSYSREDASFLKNWEENSHQTVFVVGNAIEDCLDFKDKTILFQQVFPCCDIVPATGACLVPLAIATEVKN